MSMIGNDQKNNGLNFWEILERIIGKISSIIGAGLHSVITYCKLLLRMYSTTHVLCLSYRLL